MAPQLRSQNRGIPYPEGLPNPTRSQRKDKGKRPADQGSEDPVSTKRRKAPKTGEEAEEPKETLSSPLSSPPSSPLSYPGDPTSGTLNIPDLTASSSRQPLGTRQGTTLSGLSTQSAASDSDSPAEAGNRIDQYTFASRGLHEDLLKKTLHAFIKHLPRKGSLSVSRDICKCVSDEDLYKVFANLRDELLYPMKTSRSNNIFSPSPHQKRQSQVDDVASSLSSPSSRSAKFRKLLSDRQDHKCAITGRMDHTYATEHKAITELSKSTHCEGAHIIPFCFGNFPDTAAPSKDKSEVWTALYRYFPDIRRNGLSLENINDASNGILMQKMLHTNFGLFYFSFEATNRPNVYKIKVYKNYPEDDLGYIPVSREVEFKCAPGQENIPFPAPEYLKTHYAIAEILHASGMGEVIDWHILDAEYRGVLREDGSSNVFALIAPSLLCEVRGHHHNGPAKSRKKK